MKCLPRLPERLRCERRSGGVLAVTIRPSDMLSQTQTLNERELSGHTQDAIAEKDIYTSLRAPQKNLELHPDRGRHRLRRVGRRLAVVVVALRRGGVFRADLRLVDVLELHGLQS